MTEARLRFQSFTSVSTYRNSYQEQTWEARVGSIELRIPRLGELVPCFLEPQVEGTENDRVLRWATETVPR